MNSRPSARELDRIRAEIGRALRTEDEVAEPLPQSLVALLKDLEKRVREAELERHFAEADARVAELLRVVGREPRGAHGSEGRGGCKAGFLTKTTTMTSTPTRR
jgi:hypothetical protein